jgi:hypothetical protein
LGNITADLVYLSQEFPKTQHLINVYNRNIKDNEEARSDELRLLLFLGALVILPASCSGLLFSAKPTTSKPNLQNYPMKTPI